jgi:hypothetical protein
MRADDAKMARLRQLMDARRGADGRHTHESRRAAQLLARLQASTDGAQPSRPFVAGNEGQPYEFAVTCAEALEGLLSRHQDGDHNGLVEGTDPLHPELAVTMGDVYGHAVGFLHRAKKDYKPKGKASRDQPFDVALQGLKLAVLERRLQTLGNAMHRLSATQPSVNQGLLISKFREPQKGLGADVFLRPDAASRLAIRVWKSNLSEAQRATLIHLGEQIRPDFWPQLVQREEDQEAALASVDAVDPPLAAASTAQQLENDRRQGEGLQALAARAAADGPFEIIAAPVPSDDVER